MSLDQKKKPKRGSGLWGGINHLWSFFFFFLIDSMGLVILVYSVSFCPKDVRLTEDCVCVCILNKSVYSSGKKIIDSNPK